MRHYTTRAQIIRMGAISCVLAFARVPIANMVLFWALPALTSALQLFIVGVYLPHRSFDAQKQPQVDRHRARSLEMSAVLSVLSCYNFGGAHYEHHVFPSVPWWRLHVLREALRHGNAAHSHATWAAPPG